MINDIKIGFKLMKYGLQFKTIVFAAVLLCAGGILVELEDPVSALSGFVIVMVAMLVYQLIQSVSCSTMVQSSSKKKKLQTSVSALCAGICLTILHTIIILLKLVSMHINQTPASDVVGGLFMNSILTVIVFVYMGASYKVFWLSTVAFGVGCGLLVSTMARTHIVINIPISFGEAIAISYLAILAGCILLYFISVALYKKDFSKATFESSLKRAK